MFLKHLFLENLSLLMTPLGLRNLFTSAGFVALPQDNTHPIKKKKIRISQISDFSLLFATGIFASTHDSPGPANTREELLCWKSNGLTSYRNICLPVNTARSIGRWGSSSAGWARSKAAVCSDKYFLCHWQSKLPSPSPLFRAFIKGNPLFKRILTSSCAGQGSGICCYL